MATNPPNRGGKWEAAANTMSLIHMILTGSAVVLLVGYLIALCIQFYFQNRALENTEFEKGSFELLGQVYGIIGLMIWILIILVLLFLGSLYLSLSWLLYMGVRGKDLPCLVTWTILEITIFVLMVNYTADSLFGWDWECLAGPWKMFVLFDFCTILVIMNFQLQVFLQENSETDEPLPTEGKKDRKGKGILPY